MKNILLSILFASAALAAEVPYGHKDFYPTPERPIGFRGDFTGNFPGATPVTEFYEGAHSTILNPPGEGGLRRPKTVTQLDSSIPPRNVLWKTKMPGWSLSHPIAVGNKLFAVAEPHFLLCLDATTGKVLWQREVLPLLGALPGEQPVGEKRARELQEILEIGRASDYLLPNFGNDPKDADRVIARVNEWKGRVQAIDPDPKVLAAFDTVLGKLAGVKASPDGSKVVFKGFSGGHGTIPNAVAAKYKVPIAQVWYGILGYTQLVPVSDGQYVFYMGGQGQVACFDLEGNRKWIVRLPMPPHNGCGHMMQPWLSGDVMIVHGYPVDTGKKASPKFSVYGLDKATGKVVWSHPNVGSGYKPWALMKLRTPDGKPLEVYVGTSAEIIRTSDGKVVGQLDHPVNGEDTSILGIGDKLAFCNSWNTFPGVTYTYRLTAVSRDEVKGQRLIEIGDGNPRPPVKPGAKNFDLSPAGEGVWAMTPERLWYGGYLYDLRTGRTLREVGGGSMSPIVIAGNYAIASFKPECANAYGAPLRPDRSILGEYRIWDVRVPDRPVGIRQDNWLGLEELCNDIYLEKYMKGFDRWASVGCYHGWPATFGGVYTGVFPAGDRFYIQSHTFIYCIGKTDAGIPPSKLPELAKQAEDPAKVAEVILALDRIEGAEKEKARIYLNLLKRQDAIQTALKSQLANGKIGRDMLPVPDSLRERFVLTAIGHKEFVPEYRQWVESLSGRAQIQAVQGLIVLDLPGQKDFILAKLKAALATGPDPALFETLKLLGRDAAVLLPDMEAAHAKKPSWQAESAIEHVKALSK